MSVFDGLTGKKPKGGVVTVAGTTSIDTSFAKRLVFVAFDLPYSIAE